MEPQFVDLPLPERYRRGGRQSEYRAQIETLQAGGKAYFVPLNGDDPKLVSARLGHVARKVGQERSWTVTVRATKLGVEPGVGVWRLK